MKIVLIFSVFLFLSVLSFRVASNDDISRYFLYDGKKIKLEVTRIFEPTKIDKSIYGGFLSTYDEYSIDNFKFFVGMFRHDLEEQAESGLYSVDGDKVTKLASGDNGFFIQKNDLIFVVLNEFYQHNSFATVYILEARSLSKKAFLKKIYVLNGYVASTRPGNNGVIISGTIFDEPYAVALNVIGSKVDVNTLQMIP